MRLPPAAAAAVMAVAGAGAAAAAAAAGGGGPRNPSAAAEALQQARAAYLAYRRYGGENRYRNGRMALAIRQALAAGMPAKSTSLLKQLAADPDFACQLPYLSALQAITAGSRDRSLAEAPGLSYDQAAEVLLLIEALQTGAGG